MDGVDNESRISRLESEIRYLKGLLDENGIAYDYETYVDSSKKEEPVQIEFPVLTAEHAIQFYSYFRGRKDVYVKRAVKKGYYTQCNNFWKYGVCPKASGEKVKCQDCPAKDYTELKVSAILEHLNGRKEDCTDVIGLYPLFPDGTCWFLVFDFDNHEEDAFQGFALFTLRLFCGYHRRELGSFAYFSLNCYLSSMTSKALGRLLYDSPSVPNAWARWMAVSRRWSANRSATHFSFERNFSCLEKSGMYL